MSYFYELKIKIYNTKVLEDINNEEMIHSCFATACSSNRCYIQVNPHEKT